MKHYALYILLLLLVGCASKREISTKQTVADSTIVSVHDTTVIISRDTITKHTDHTSLQTDTVYIHFPEGTGTYNTHTGLFSGIGSMQYKSTKAKATKTIEAQAKEIKMLKTENDSLRHIITDSSLTSQSEQETKDITPASKAANSFFWGMLVGAVLVVVVRLLWKIFIKSVLKI